MTAPAAGFLAAPSAARTDPGERRRARLSLAVLLLLVFLCLLGDDRTGGAAMDPTPAILDGARHGIDYYQAVADALRFQESDRPSAWAVPLPAAMLLRATLPDHVTMALVWALATAVFLAWYVRLAPSRLGGRIGVAALLAAVLAPWLLPAAGDAPETWAGLLAAIALAIRSERHWPEAVALGLAAAVFSVAAAPLFLGAAAITGWRGRSREAMGWAGAFALAMAVLAFHLAAVARVVPAVSLAPPLGAGGVIAGIREAAVLGLLPFWVTALLVAGAAWAWVQVDRSGVLTAALVALALAAMVTMLPVGPVLVVPLLAGLALLPRTLGATLRVAGTRGRRITVRRVVR